MLPLEKLSLVGRACNQTVCPQSLPGCSLTGACSCPSLSPGQESLKWCCPPSGLLEQCHACGPTWMGSSHGCTSNVHRHRMCSVYKACTLDLCERGPAATGTKTTASLTGGAEPPELRVQGGGISRVWMTVLCRRGSSVPELRQVWLGEGQSGK